MKGTEQTANQLDHSKYSNFSFLTWWMTHKKVIWFVAYFTQSEMKEKYFEVAMYKTRFENGKRTKKRDEQHRVRRRIKMKTVIIIPDNWLNNKRQWAEMTLMDYCSNKLQRKSKLITFKTISSRDKICQHNFLKERKYMLKGIVSLICRRRHQTWPSHPIQQIMTKKYNFLGVELDPAFKWEPLAYKESWAFINSQTNFTRCTAYISSSSSSFY